MKSKITEDGYALLTVLMLVLLFTTLGMGLLAMNINASKQFNVKEEQVQARHQAEMGLLHYHAEIKKKAIEYKFTRSSEEEEDDALKRSRNEICLEIKEVDLPTESGANGNYTISNRVIEGCAENASGAIKISLRSTGISNGNSEKIIDGSIELTPPALNFNEETVPVKPDTDTEGEYTEEEGPLTIRKGNMEFDTLVINRSPTEKNSDKKDDGQTLQFGEGKGESLIINEDLYVDGTIYSQNHSCIYVRGDMTVRGKIFLNTQSSIIVLGNAYFLGTIDLHNNANIYVAGNTYVGANKELINTYNSTGNFRDQCGNLPVWPQPEPEEYRWQAKDNLNPYYH